MVSNRVMAQVLPPQLMVVVRATPPLSPDGEREAHARGDVALLVRSHLRMIPRHVLDCIRHNSDLLAEDLCAQALMGLVIGCQRWRPDGGARVASYATWWIRAMLRRYVQQHRHPISMPLNRAGRTLFSNLRRTQGELAARTGEAPHALVATRLCVKESDVRLMDELLSMRSMPLDNERDAHGAESVELVIGRRDDERDARLAVRALMRKLTPRERHVVELCALREEPLTLAAVGAQLNLSRERVRQLRLHALEKMRVEAARRGAFCVEETQRLLAARRTR